MTVAPRLDYRFACDLLFRRFVGLAIDEAVLDATVFYKNRDARRRHRPQVHDHGAQSAAGALVAPVTA
jgi:hypothetical protein